MAARYFESSPVAEHEHGKAQKVTVVTASRGSSVEETIKLKSSGDLSRPEDNSNQEQREFGVLRKKKMFHDFRNVDPFPGDAPLPKSKMKKYKRGEKMDHSAKTKYHKARFAMEEEKISQAVKQAARTDVFLQEEAGYLEMEEGEDSTQLSQYDIQDSVDITSAQKFFELKLPEFGPYRLNYTRNGRYLLIGGNKGHVAAIDWLTKKLMCEVNVMETVNDVRWLHQETMFAVAQKQWTYMYDNQGIELHCLKSLDCVLRLEFLSYHFLLVSANSKGYLSYLDVSVGQKVAGHRTGLGRLDVMCQNPSNAIICLGHAGGTVTMWSPNLKEPVVKMLCHGGGIRSVAVEKKGSYLATSGIDRTIKIWDLRTYKMLHSYKVGAGAGNLAFSQRELLAAGMGNVVQVYEDCCTRPVTSPYLTHRLPSTVHGLQFCPYEDVLGVGHGQGFSSLLIPGAGEANFDALEANPYQTKSQRRHAEVKMLLEKIPPDMIHLDTAKIGQVDTKTLQQTLEEKNKLIFLKPQKVDFVPKYKKKGRSKAGRVEKRKKGVREFSKREVVKELIIEKQKEDRRKNKGQNTSENVLDRFKKSNS